MKNSNPLERQIEQSVCKYAESKGVLQYKFVSPARRHVPDRIFICGPNGRVFWIEFKRFGEKATRAQALEHEKMRKRGATVYVVDDEFTGKSIVDGEINEK